MSNFFIAVFQCVCFVVLQLSHALTLQKLNSFYYYYIIINIFIMILWCCMGVLYCCINVLYFYIGSKTPQRNYCKEVMLTEGALL